MTYRELLNIFKQRYPGISVHDYRPVVKMHIPTHLPGIVIWTEQGDVIVFFLHENELEKLASCSFEEPEGAYEITAKAKTNFEEVTASPEKLANFIYHQLGDAICFGMNRILKHRCLSEKDWQEWLKQEVTK